MTGGIVGVATIIDCVTSSDSKWFMGKYGFVLADAKPLPFVPCKGQLNFFDIPEDAAATLRAMHAKEQS